MSRQSTLTLRDERGNVVGSVELDSTESNNVVIEIDGAEYGGFYADAIQPGGWRLAFGQYDDRSSDWVTRNPIQRLGGWIELNDGGYYPVVDGTACFLAPEDRYPVTFDTPEEAYAALYAVMVVNQRDLKPLSEIAVVDLRSDDLR
ncbi:hypothetical protein SEA_OBLADI_151 [Gordonia phage ObLaDi]|uniref:Uncharacterized protein n=1 Tax=Gordonia phage ObLaDi TaxID=2978487 RepID=A0A977KLV0_9CAUD|nr:hypothetical protein SEA_OBLADI_151 [Gordonia phage ObLaDi]